MSTGRTMFLTRVQSLDTATYGVLHLAGQAPFAVTLELPWEQNARRISKIPAGSYRCARVQSPKFGDTFEVTDVEGRSHILFHWGNYVKDTEGCILIGTSWADLDGDGITDLTASRIGFNIFKTLTRGWREFPLIIRELTDRDVVMAPVSGASTSSVAGASPAASYHPAPSRP
jgi:hypothetical protein